MKVIGNKKIANKNRTSVVRLTKIGMLAGVSFVLMLFQVPLPFAPPFYQIDLSEAPVLIGTFALGPFAGMAIEFVKILLNLLVNGTTTVGVGELANFIIGCSFVIPAGMIYKKRQTRKSAIIGMMVGVMCMVIFGCLLNAYVLLPVYATAFNMPIDGLIEMGTAVNAGITDLLTFVVYAVAPFNLLKGIVVSAIVVIIYKKISRVLR